MSHVPSSFSDTQFLELAVTAADVDVVSENRHAQKAVTGNWHGCSVDLAADAEETDFTTGGAGEEHVALDFSVVVVSNQTCVW